MIQPNVPFVWLRGDPSSSAEIRAEVVRSSLAILTVVKFPSAWDGYQNWWLVGSPNTTALTGWVEQASLLDTTAIAPTPTALDPAVWGTPFSATIRRGLPFVWIRSRPDSNGTILDTLVPNDRYTVLGTPEHVFDGRQWWWYVRKTYPSGGYTEGYIEEQSIIPLG